MVVKEIKKEAPKKPNLKYERDRMREKVEGIFRFYEVPGGSIGFNYKEFKEDPIERYYMVDGVQYTVPLGVARHLNRNGWYPEYGHVTIEGNTGVKNAAVDANQYQQRVVKKVRRYSFQSLQFIDLDEMAPEKQILEVQTV